ncbi:MAG TPA: fibronectin type III domain-containing protein [Patescibacteria group bacterium]|nr:fibronectin type III domain-containing protein [Patescibacteria group bacterium]
MDTAASQSPNPNFGSIPDNNSSPALDPKPNSGPPDPFVPGTGFKAAGFKTESAVVSPQSPAPPSTVSTFAAAEKPKGGGTSKSVVMVAVLVLVLAGLVAGFGKIRAFISSAQGSCEPESLTESNLTASSVEITFQTGKTCQMEVTYGMSQGALLLQVPETMASLNHRIRLTPLLASTTYYYQVVHNGKKMGPTRSFLTKPPAAPSPTVTPTVVSPIETVPTTEATPTTSEATSSATTSYTLQDFQSHFGSSSAEFDLDKNGVVNSADWLLYQNTQ